MATPQTIVRGDETPQLRRVIYDFDPQRGWNVVGEYDGASQVLMETLAKQYAAAGIACRLIYENDKASIESHDATQQYTLDTWQILGNEESWDGLSHPTVLSICTDNQVASLRAGINNINTSLLVSDAITEMLANAAFDGISDPDKATLGRFVGLQLRGSTDYRKAQYVLRHTTNCPNRWPVGTPASWPANLAMSNVEGIYTYSSLITEVTSPSYWILPLPPEMVHTLSQIPEILVPPANYHWGWLKGASTTTTAANNRVEISTEYTHELWSTDYYPNVV